MNSDPFSSIDPLIKKAVIVAPVSLLVNWKKEVKKWLGDARLIPKLALGERDQVNSFSKFMNKVDIHDLIFTKIKIIKLNILLNI